MKIKLAIILFPCFLLYSCGTIYEGSEQQKKDEIEARKKFYEKKWENNTQAAKDLLSRELGENEVIIIGKLRLFVQGQRELTKDIDFIFNRSFWSINDAGSIQVMNPEGYFCTTMSVGKNTLDGFRFEYGYSYWEFTSSNKPTFELREGKKVYYLGDIFIDLYPEKRGVRILVTDNEKDAIEFFTGQKKNQIKYASALVATKCADMCLMERKIISK
jgi:hypothetical protein